MLHSKGLTMTRYWRLPHIIGNGRLSDRSIEIAEALNSEPRPTYSQLAEKFGITKQRVGQIALRMGKEYGGSGRRVMSEVNNVDLG